MSTGASDLGMVINRGGKSMVVTGENWFAQNLTLAITGHSHATTNLILLAYRDDVLVAATDAGDITGTSDLAAGYLDTATEEMQTAMADALHGEIVDIDLRMWDSETLELIAEGVLRLRGVLINEAMTPLTPLSSTTIFWGDLCSYLGKTYMKNNEDGLWYPFSLRGTGATVHYTIDETGGIAIPGG